MSSIDLSQMGLVNKLGDYVFGSSFLVLFVVPAVLLIGILLCRRYNISLIPPNNLQGETIQPFRFPKLFRKKHGRVYKWYVDENPHSTTEDPSSMYD